MFDYIYEWLWNLVCYMVLATVVLQALPKNSYQKYVRFIFGLLLTMLLVSPVLRIFGMEESLYQRYHSAEYERMIREMERASSWIMEEEGERK